jgi:hypothetical protein
MGNACGKDGAKNSGSDKPEKKTTTRKPKKIKETGLVDDTFD